MSRAYIYQNLYFIILLAIHTWNTFVNNLDKKFQKMDPLIILKIVPYFSLQSKNCQLQIDITGILTLWNNPIILIWRVQTYQNS